MSKTAWIVKKKRGDVSGTPRFGPLKVTIVEEEIAPVTISDIESTGSTTYAVSAVSVSTSNNREEPPPIGKSWQKRQMAKNQLLATPRLAVNEQHGVPHLHMPPRWSKSIDAEDSGRGVMLSPVESPKISPKLQSVPDETERNGYISPQISTTDKKFPQSISPGGRLGPKEQGSVRVWVDALGTNNLPESKKLSTLYIGERRVFGKPDAEVLTTSVALVSDNAGLSPESALDSAKSEANGANAVAFDDMLHNGAPDGLSEGFALNGETSAVYQEQEEGLQGAWSGARLENPYASNIDRCDKADGIIPRALCSVEGSQRSRGLNGGIFINSMDKAEDKDDVASPMSSSTVSEDVDILRQRLGSPMPEEFYETVMAKSRETRENHYSNELFEHAREYLSHMLSQEGSTDGVQKEIESPFSFPGGEDAGPSAIAQLADFSMQGSENMPEIANNLKSASPERCIRKAAGVSERKKQQLQWRDGESAIELSIRSKSDAARSGYLKYPISDEEDNYEVVTAYARELGAESELEIVPELGPIDISRISLPLMTPPPLERPSYSAASVISMPALGSDISEEELLRNSANFRQFVRDLQTVARTGSIGQVRRILGVDDAFDLESQAFTETEELQMRTAEAQNVQPGPSQTQTQQEDSQTSSTTAEPCERKETVYYDAEDGPLFWEEETWEDVQSLAAQVMSGNKAVPKHSARASASTDDIPIPHDCSPEEVGDIANQLRDVIKVRSRQLDSVCGSSDVFASWTPMQGITVFSAQRDTPRYNPEKTIKRRSRRIRQRPESESPSKTGGIQKLVSIFQRRRNSASSRSEGSSLRNADVRTESPTSSRYDRLDEVSSLSSFNNVVKPVMEPSASSSGALPPHPLHEVASVKNVMTSEELGLVECNSNSAAATETHHPSSQGSSVSSTLEQRYCMLKLNFQLQGAGSSDEKSDPIRSDLNSDARKQVSKRSRRSLEPKKPSKTCLSADFQVQEIIPELPTPREISEPVKKGYVPTNDVNQILTTVSKDIGTWVGPLSDKEFEFYSQFSGTWKTDWNISDNFDSLCKVMKLGWVFRKGLEASDCLSFDMTRTECKSAAKVIGCINLIEIHPWIGTSIVHRRRDQRRGPAQCWVERYDGGFVMRIDWNEPLGGNIYEFVELSSDKTRMVVRQELYRKTGGLSSHTRIVFDRVTKSARL